MFTTLTTSLFEVSDASSASLIHYSFSNAKNLNEFVEAVLHFRDALAEAVKRESSAEARAIERLKEEKEGKSVEWITVIDRGQEINIEEVRKRLKKRGYTSRTHLKSENSLENQ